MPIRQRALLDLLPRQWHHVFRDDYWHYCHIFVLLLHLMLLIILIFLLLFLFLLKSGALI